MGEHVTPKPVINALLTWSDRAPLLLDRKRLVAGCEVLEHTLVAPENLIAISPEAACLGFLAVGPLLGRLLEAGFEVLVGLSDFFM